MEYKRKSHCVYHCEYHVIISTKYRRKIFNEGIFEYIRLKLKKVEEHYPEINIKEINYDKDHIHMLIEIPPTISVGSAIRIIKSNTSKGLKQKFPFLSEVYWGSDGIWSDGYFASTVGINEKAIRAYIENQGKEDSGQAKLELG